MIKLLLSGLSVMGFSIPVITEIFLFIDGIIYKVAALALEAFFEVIRITGQLKVNSEIVGPILSRVMVLAGVFALFRVAIMLINYLIDPDKVNKATSDGTTFAKNIIIAAVLLVLLPTMFGFMNDLQNAIIESDVIPKIVYGNDNYNNGQVDFVTFRFKNDSDGKQIAFQAQKFVNNVFLLFYDDDGKCEESNAGPCARYNAVKAGNGTIKSLILESNIFTYTSIFSGIMGLLLVYYFLSFAVELAIRMVRLVVLEVLSPIPVIMSIDPSQKDRLRNFGTTYISTWLSAFIRILTVYIALVVCTFISNNVNILSTAATNVNLMLKVGFFVKVIIYIGIFQAAKELPKLVDDVIGTKIASSSQGKSFGNVLKGIVGSGAGLVGGGIAGGVAGATAGGAGNIAQGILTGAASGAWNGAKARNAKDLIGAASTTVGSIRGAHGTAASIIEKGGIGLATAAGVRNFFGGQGRDQREIAEFDQKIDAINKSKENINTASGKRADIQNKLNDMYAKKTGYNSLEDYLNNSSSQQALNYRTWRDIYNSDSSESISSQSTLNQSAREDERIRMNEARNAAELAYNSELDSYSRSQFNIAQGYIQNPTEMQAQGYTLDDADLATMISDYNKYVTEHHMGGDNGDMDRRLTDYSQMKKYDSDDKIAINNHNRDLANTEELKKNKMNDPMYKASNPKSGSKN